MTRPRDRIPHPAVRIPAKVEVSGETLVWEYAAESSEYRTPSDAAVIAFSKLADAPPDQVAKFAARYGVLSAVQIKQEYQRDSDIRLSDGSIWRPGSDLAYVFDSKLQGSEPLLLWRFLARRLRALLRINSALKGRSRTPLPAIGTEEDWLVLGLKGQPFFDDVRDAQFFLCQETNEWLGSGSVRLRLGITEWSRTRTDWKLEVDYDGLLGAIAYRLMLMVIGEANLYACYGCGQPYIRLKRAPRPGQENFCDDCEGIAQTRATQRYRAKKAKGTLS